MASVVYSELSYEACMDLSRSLYRSQKINREQLHSLGKAVVSPEMLGIDQRGVDECYATCKLGIGGRQNGMKLSRMGLAYRSMK